MRRSIMAVLISGSGCGGGGPVDPLNTDGPPRILQVLARERVVVTDDEGHQHVELHARLAFGDHPDLDPEVDDREVGAAVARDGQRLRVVVDELLRGNHLEEIPCADGTWGRVPVGTDFDDIARCAGTDLSRCESVCLGAAGPIGILDANGDGAIDDTRLIDGAVILTCDGVVVPLDAQRSYYQPAGSQLIAGGSVGTDSLGPAIAITPAAGMRPGARCTIGFAATVVDKQGVAICAPADAGCTPGDTSAIGFGVEAFTLAASEPADGATEVALTGHDSTDATITLLLNAELAADSVSQAIRVTAGGEAVEELAPVMAEDDGATVTITVPGGFRAGTEYAVTISGGATGIKDRYDDTLAQDHTIRWTTASEQRSAP